jgi:hypothetical protein
MRTLTPMEFWSLLAVTLFNLYTYWLANQAALPGLSMKKSAVVTQTGTTVANTLPAGGAVAIGITYAILHSWGFTGTETGLFVGVTGIIGEPMSVQIHARQGHHEREPDGDPFPLLASGYRVAKNRVYTRPSPVRGGCSRVEEPREGCSAVRSHAEESQSPRVRRVACGWVHSGIRSATRARDRGGSRAGSALTLPRRPPEDDLHAERVVDGDCPPITGQRWESALPRRRRNQCVATGRICPWRSR